jgi:hypothetical protein
MVDNLRPKSELRLVAGARNQRYLQLWSGGVNSKDTD